MAKVVKGINTNKAAYLLLWAMLMGFLVLLIRTAWLCDDAYITLRTVDNFVNGYGLRWNVAERVQSYTNPLWLLLLSSLQFITHEAYFTTIILSMAVTMAALFVYARWVAASRAMAILGLLIFMLSRAYVDFSTSGLENPLSHLLIFAFMAVYLRHEGRWGKREVFILSLIASLGVLNRMDTALVYAPPMLYALVTRKNPRFWLTAFLGTLPFLAWEAFSFFYYGFLFPNTAYAKLNHGIDSMTLFNSGVNYFTESLWVDPLTLLAVSGGIAVSFAGRRRAHVSVAAGILLYLIYVARVGGDFMSGRYFTVPLAAGVALLTAQRLGQRSNGRWVLSISFSLVLILGMLAYYPTVFTGPRYGLERSRISVVPGSEAEMIFWESPRAFRFAEGITDERASYYQFTGMLRDPEVNGSMGIKHDWATLGRFISSKGIKVNTLRYAGFTGYFGGPQIYHIDVMALNDPLLARLPAIDRENVLIGHYRRSIPLGYPESVRDDNNLIKDPAIAIFYDDLRLVTRGALISKERFKAVWRVNTKDYGLPATSDQYEADPRDPDMLHLF